MSTAFGVDVGGSGIKGARVDLASGKMLTERLRIPTPQPATPDRVMDVVAEVVVQSQWDGPFGCTFPAVVQDGVVRTATNIDDTWLGTNARVGLQKRLNHPVRVLNDADAAGMAEMKFGAGIPCQSRGVVLMLTFGTGIGSALFTNGQLLPNTELGDLQIDGYIAETRAAGRLREEEILGWDEWIGRVQAYLTHVELLFWPDLIIFGGGISELHDQFLPRLKTRARLVPADLRNNAGIVGAAYAGRSLTAEDAE